MKREGVMVIIRDPQGRFLMGKRSLTETAAPGYWATLSGTIEPFESGDPSGSGETGRATVIRECLEEAGIVVEPLARIAEFDTRDGRYRLHYWTARIVSGTPRVMTDELSELRWVTREELDGLSPAFAEDIELLKRQP